MPLAQNHGIIILASTLTYKAERISERGILRINNQFPGCMGEKWLITNLTRTVKVLLPGMRSSPWQEGDLVTTLIAAAELRLRPSGHKPVSPSSAHRFRIIGAISVRAVSSQIKSSTDRSASIPIGACICPGIRSTRSIIPDPPPPR